MSLKFYSLDEKVIFSTYDLDLAELNAKTVDANEKHVPVVEINGSLVHVKVGSIPHPMTEEHQIEYILVETDKGFYVKDLDFNTPAEATFTLTTGEKVLKVYAYCNLHGLYLKEV